MQQATRVQTQSYPESNECCQCYSGQEVSGEFVITCCYSSKILEAAESVFDEMPVPISSFVVDDLPLSIATARYHGNGI